MNNFYQKNKNFLYIAINSLIAMFFILDRILKNLAINLENKKNIFGEFFQFSFVSNKYIAFSIPISEKILFNLILFLLIIILFFLFFLFNKKKYLEFFGFLGILVGALSNFIDRLYYNFVIDYLDLKYFTVFNLADVLIFISAVYLLVYYYKQDKN